MSDLDPHYSRFVREFPYRRTLRTYQWAADQSMVVYRHRRKLIDFSSNDYLGLAQHPLLIARSQEFSQRLGTGAASSRMVRGNYEAYDQIEQKLAQLVGKHTTLILGTGFQTNASVIEALTDSKVLGLAPLIFCDKLCHASIFAGLSQFERRYRFRHNDLSHLQTLLEKFSDDARPKFIFAESLYSMEGDSVDLDRLTALAQDHGATLYVDDAHALGILGQQGAGLTAALGPKIAFSMGTFSKALGSFGGYLACSHAARDYLLHRCKGLLYSTALPPAVLGSITAALELLPYLNAEREHLQKLSRCTRQFFDEQGLNYGTSNSHIIPWILGCAEKTNLAAQLLEAEGILGAPIQVPSVPPQKNRIRLCLSALHTEADLGCLFAALTKVSRALSGSSQILMPTPL